MIGIRFLLAVILGVVALQSCTDEPLSGLDYDLQFPLEKAIEDDHISSVKGFVQMAVDSINQHLILCDTEGERLLVYDLSGNFLSIWDKSKFDNAKFSRPFSIAVGKGRIAVACESPGILFLKLNGDYIGELRQNSDLKRLGLVSLIWFDQRANLWFGLNSFEEENFRFLFMVYEASLDSLMTLDFHLLNPVSRLRREKVTMTHIMSPAYVAATNKGFYIKDSFDYKIYFLAYLSMTTETIIDRREERIRMDLKELNRLKKKAEATGHTLVHFEFYPVLDQIFLDDMQNVWMAKSVDVLNSREGNHEIHVFDSSGGFLGKGKTNILSTRNTTPIFFQDKIYSLTENGKGGIQLKIFINTTPLEKRIMYLKENYVLTRKRGRRTTNQEPRPFPTLFEYLFSHHVI